MYHCSMAFGIRSDGCSFNYHELRFTLFTTGNTRFTASKRKHCIRICDCWTFTVGRSVGIEQSNTGSTLVGSCCTCKSWFRITSSGQTRSKYTKKTQTNAFGYLNNEKKIKLWFIITSLTRLFFLKKQTTCFIEYATNYLILNIR